MMSDKVEIVITRKPPIEPKHGVEVGNEYEATALEHKRGQPEIEFISPKSGALVRLMHGEYDYV